VDTDQHGSTIARPGNPHPVLFGRGDPAALFDMTLDALAINDPYVPERMLAATYGTTMTLHGDPANQDFTGRILPSFAVKLCQQMFEKDAPYSTTHALMRDFARHTIQIALHHSPTLLSAKQRKRVAPPFRDGGMRKWGVAEDRNKGQYREGNAPIQMDFENYTIGRLVPERHNYQFEHGGYQQALGNIYWRLYSLGYSLESFGEIDKHIASSRWRGRIEDNAGRVDRYGKKYSWIAFFELYGLHFDKGMLKEKYYETNERPTDVDIDPSFPDEPHNIQVISADWLGDRKRSLSAWINHGERPEIMPYLLMDEVNSVRGPWVLLDGFISQVDKHHKRSLFAFPRGLFVPKRHSQEMQHLLAKQKLAKLRLPEIPEDYYTFAGEIPWCETFPKNGRTDLEVHIGHRIKKLPRNEGRFYREGKKLNEEETRALLRKLLLVTNEENRDQAALNLMKAERVTYRTIKTWSTSKEAVSKTLPALLPVRESNWESYHNGVNPGQHAIVPAREIAEAFGFSISPPSWDMRDADGEWASIAIKWGNLWATGHALCYLRKDVLDQFLKRKRLEFIWAFWGAREIRLATEEYHDQGKTFNHWRKDFQRIYRYKNGCVIAGKASEHYG
jgi:hypothetical protein